MPPTRDELSELAETFNRMLDRIQKGFRQQQRFVSDASHELRTPVTVKCYGSSMAFKARMEKVPGVHGVKTYVGTHSVVLSYDPKVTDEERIMEQIYVPAHFRIWSPDPKKLDSLKCVTIRTEKMSGSCPSSLFFPEFLRY